MPPIEGETVKASLAQRERGWTPFDDTWLYSPRRSPPQRTDQRLEVVALEPATKGSSVQAVNCSEQGGRVDRPILTKDDYIEYEESREDHVSQNWPSSHLYVKAAERCRQVQPYKLSHCRWGVGRSSQPRKQGRH